LTVGRETPTRYSISVFATPVGGQQHDPRPLRQTRPHRQRARQRRQAVTITITQAKSGSSTSSPHQFSPDPKRKLTK
jgi:choline dehydrogenase-like flavoprotein